MKIRNENENTCAKLQGRKSVQWSLETSMYKCTNLDLNIFSKICQRLKNVTKASGTPITKRYAKISDPINDRAPT